MRISNATVLDESYQYAFEKFQSRPFPSVQEARTVLEQIKKDPRVAKADPESFVDLTLLKELEKEGFFNRIK